MTLAFPDARLFSVWLSQCRVCGYGFMRALSVSAWRSGVDVPALSVCHGSVAYDCGHDVGNLLLLLPGGCAHILVWDDKHGGSSEQSGPAGPFMRVWASKVRTLHAVLAAMW